MIADRWPLRTNSYLKRADFNLKAGCCQGGSEGNQTLLRSGTDQFDETCFVHKGKRVECGGRQLFIDSLMAVGSERRQQICSLTWLT